MNISLWLFFNKLSDSRQMNGTTCTLSSIINSVSAVPKKLTAVQEARESIVFAGNMFSLHHSISLLLVMTVVVSSLITR